jgi:hypothetical protein
MCIERRSSRSPRPWHRHLPWHLITGAPHRVPNLFPWAILIAFTGSIMTVAFAYAAEAIKVRRTSPLPRSLLCQLDSPPLRCAGPAELKPVELSVVRPNCSWWDEYTRSSPVGCFGTRKIHGRSRIAQIRRPRPPPAASAAVPQARSRCIRGFHGGARFGRRGEATGSAARVRLACPPDAHEHMLGRRIRGRQQGAHGLGCVPVPCHAGLGSPSAALSARECCVCGVSGTQHRAVLWFTYEFNHVPDDRLSNG